MLTGSTQDVPPSHDTYITLLQSVLALYPKFTVESTEEELGHPTFAHPVPQ